MNIVINKELSARFADFKKTMGDLDKDPVKVFKPLQQWQVDEILLIREISKDLQKKKDEDTLKAKQAAAEIKEIKEAEKEVEKEIEKEVEKEVQKVA